MELTQVALSCRYDGFVCLNSGSECVSLAMRIMDVDARKMTSTHDEAAPHPGRDTVLVSLQGSFHGRTDRPAQASDSCQTAYKKHLASFRDRSTLRTVEANNVSMLQEVFEEVCFVAWVASPSKQTFHLMFVSPLSCPLAD